MNIPYQTVISPKSRETAPNLVPFDPSERGQQYVEQYQALVGSFKNLFTLCRPPDASPNLSQHLLNINLYKTTPVQHGRLAIVRSIDSTGYPGNWSTFQEADGFDVREYDYEPKMDGYNLLTSTETYSLGHQGCDENSHLYTNRPWTPERTANIAEWLHEHLPKSQLTLEKLFTAASDAELNPQLAQNIVKHGSKIGRLATSAELPSIVA
ncbi:MAG: hypothetical protein ACR2FM_05980 [Candidatus Saccharimonadales bacterium]